MITGFNTDIQHEGTTYHVQTEDKGLDTPLVLSLVYVGGAILASKRAPYQDLIDTGFDENKLVERLQRQHTLICAAISAGRIEDLKRMAERDVARNTERSSGEVENKTPQTGAQEIIEASTNLLSQPDAFAPASIAETTFAVEAFSAPGVSEYGLSESKDIAESVERADEGVDEFLEDLYLHLLDDDGDFRAGQLATIKIHVGRGAYGRQSVAGVSVMIKVLGTTFRPMILETNTDAEGVAIVRALLPRFSSGRAAIIIRAETGEDHAEVRRIIHHS